MSKTAAATKSKSKASALALKFEAFEPLDHGNGCNGANVWDESVAGAAPVIARITRETESRDVGHVSCVWRSKVVGYEVWLQFAPINAEDVVYKTLKEARDAVRAAYAAHLAATARALRVLSTPR